MYYVKYCFDDIKLNVELCVDLHYKFTDKVFNDWLKTTNPFPWIKRH